MIQVESLTKYYGPHAAVRDIGFSIDRGEVIGFLGLNGAGKTTTLKILGCVLLPTSGRVTIDGFDVVKDPHEIRKRIGFLPDTPPLYDEMTVDGYLKFVAALRGVDSKSVHARAREAAEKTALVDVQEEVISSLSHGYRQRVGVAQALVHQPQLIILDEPTSGLDPVQIVEMRSLIRGLKGHHTVLVSSHILSEISQTCDRLLVIQDGELVAQGSEADLAARAGAGLAIEVDVLGDAGKAVAALKAVPGVADVTSAAKDAGLTTLTVKASTELRPQLLRALVSANVDVVRLDRGTQRLESIFLKLTHSKEASA